MSKSIIKIHYLFTILLLFVISCKENDKQLICFNENLNEIKRNKQYKIIIPQFYDSLYKWWKMDLYTMNALYNDDWIIDSGVFFNKSFDKAVLLIIQRDTNKLNHYGNNEWREPTLDYINPVYAEFENNSWNFYYGASPNMVIPRDKNTLHKARSLKELSDIGRKSILRSYYKKYTCEMDERFFDADGSFNPSNYKELQVRFLNSGTKK